MRDEEFIDRYFRNKCFYCERNLECVCFTCVKRKRCKRLVVCHPKILGALRGCDKYSEGFIKDLIRKFKERKGD